MPILGIDLGTTHCKAAIFEENGRLISLATRSTSVHRDPKGFSFYSPKEIWQAVIDIIREVMHNHPEGVIDAIGISSMAETGLLLDKDSDEPVCPLLPWFDPVTTPQAEELSELDDPFTRFIRSGITPSFKCGLAKLRWLRDQGYELSGNVAWLSTADWLAFLLTGSTSTDYSLAGRSYAFRLDQKTWNEELLREVGLSGNIFPPARPSGTVVGKITAASSREAGLAEGLPVAIAGHDHICGAFASGAINPGQVFDSMGTAEAFFGSMDERPLTRADFESGLNYGLHVAPGRMYWLGGLSSSGGSLEWLLGITHTSSYEELEDLQNQMDSQPGDLLYYPYLAGSGSPHTDLHVRASFIGLTAAHRSIDLLKAVFEGTAYEAEFIRRTGERVLGMPITSIIAAGGGTRNNRWMQIKADVSGCRYQVLKMPEATLAGAALLAGIGAGIYPSPGEALKTWQVPSQATIMPDFKRHERYDKKYIRNYLKFQEPLRQFHKANPPNEKRNKDDYSPLPS
jgi:xylulokinase